MKRIYCYLIVLIFTHNIKSTVVTLTLKDNAKIDLDITNNENEQKIWNYFLTNSEIIKSLVEDTPRESTATDITIPLPNITLADWNNLRFC